MNSLYVLVENFTNGFRVESLDVISLISVLCGILVIVTKNPIVSVLFLIGLFLSISNYLILLGLNFIGLSYLLVYVGAVSILFLFILMLINVRVSELLSNTSNSIPLAIIIAISYNYPVNHILPYSIAVYNSFTLNLSSIFNSVEYISHGAYSDNLFRGIEQNNGEVFFATSKVWDSFLSETTHITSIGSIMYTNYSIWLILTSIILLLAMVGAIVITIKQNI